MNNNFLLHLLFFINLYIIFSIIEWIVHKYIMHSNLNINISNNHILHHKQTKSNMNILLNNKNKYSGIFFTWNETILVLTVGLLVALMLNYFYKLNIIYVVIITILFAFYQSTLWNTLHPEIHNVKYKISIKEGIPHNYYLKYLPYYNWLYVNHVKHHKIKNSKKGNYNITLPGADFIFLSYN